MGKMKSRAIRVQSIVTFLLVLSAGSGLPTGLLLAQEDRCLGCHQEFEDSDGPSFKISRDIHFQRGLGCVDCHGGDPALDDMDEVRAVKGYRGAPDHYQIPEFCGRCHSDAAYMRNHNPSLPTDQLDKYRTSVHGQLLFGKRDAKVADCVSCHSVHEIAGGKIPHSATYPTNLPFTCGKCHSDSAYMAPYGIPTDQVAKFQQSVHGQALLEKNDLGAPSCNSCHSNHGAAPPGVASLAAVCGNCHAFEAQAFLKSPHREAFEANDFPMCETCHSNHLVEKPDDRMIGPGDGSTCMECHAVDDGTRAFLVADSASHLIGKLVAAHDSARTLVVEAAAKGMMTTDEEFALKEVNQLLIQTRTLVHAFALDELAPKAEAGLAKADSLQGNAAALIDDYYFRRKGLALATLFITIAAIALYLKIRKMG